MHLCFKIVKFLLHLCRSTCFGHCCVHHQEPSTTSHAASGYHVILCWLRPPALQYQQNSAGGRNQHKITR
jgi:hypothetical protein